jgi:hypothetical protein
LQNILGRFERIPFPIENFIRFFAGLIHVVFEVHVIEAFFYGITFVRVEHQHFSEQVESSRVGVRVNLVPFLLASLGLFTQEFALTFSYNEFFVFLSWGSKNANSSLNLIKIVVAREKGSSAKQFGKNATDRPDIEGLCVMSSVQNDFRSSIPSGNNVFSKSFLNFLFFITSRESEIANFEFATFVKKHIARFKISVDNVGRMEVVSSGEKLVHEVLQVLICQLLSRVNNSVHISFHQFGDNVNIFVPSGCRGLQNINQVNDVLLVKELQQLDFSHDTLGID